MTRFEDDPARRAIIKRGRRITRHREREDNFGARSLTEYWFEVEGRAVRFIQPGFAVRGRILDHRLRAGEKPDYLVVKIPGHNFYAGRMVNSNTHGARYSPVEVKVFRIIRERINGAGLREVVADCLLSFEARG